MLSFLQTLISSACVEHLDFLSSLPETYTFEPFEECKHGQTSFKSLTDIPTVTDIADQTILDEQVNRKQQDCSVERGNIIQICRYIALLAYYVNIFILFVSSLSLVHYMYLVCLWFII